MICMPEEVMTGDLLVRVLQRFTFADDPPAVKEVPVMGIVVGKELSELTHIIVISCLRASGDFEKTYCYVKDRDDSSWDTCEVERNERCL